MNIEAATDAYYISSIDNNVRINDHVHLSLTFHSRQGMKSVFKA